MCHLLPNFNKVSVSIHDSQVEAEQRGGEGCVVRPLHEAYNIAATGLQTSEPDKTTANNGDALLLL